MKVVVMMFYNGDKILTYYDDKEIIKELLDGDREWDSEYCG